MSGERSFPHHGRVALVDLISAWRDIARQTATLQPDTPEWQQLADEARHRRALIDQRIADISALQVAFRQGHPRPRVR